MQQRPFGVAVLAIAAAVRPEEYDAGTYVVLNPILAAILLREAIPRSTWVAVLIATAGLATLSLNGFGFGVGEGVTLLAAGF